MSVFNEDGPLAPDASPEPFLERRPDPLLVVTLELLKWAAVFGAFAALAVWLEGRQP